MNFLSKTLTALLMIIGFVGSTSFLVASEKPKDHELLSKCPVSEGFDFPVGKPNAKGYYNAQKFGKKYHLGEDWNGTGGGNSDLGDPVYSISDGIVVFSEDIKGGWGKVVRIVHKLGIKKVSNENKPRYLESVYAHFKETQVKVGQIVRKGEQIGTIGNADGQYWAHLHFELRDEINLPIGQGYSKNTKGYLNPTKFIRKHRKISL